MKARFAVLKAFFCICIASFFLVQTSSSPSPGDQVCGLNLTSFPYEPSGECIYGVSEKIKDWDGLPKESCCRNALTVLSQALALQAATGEGNIFIKEDQWRNCDVAFKLQQSVSIQSCGFRELHQGSSHCSSLQLSTIKQDQIYQYVLNQCTFFTSSFDDACKNCTAAIIKARDKLLDRFNVRGHPTETALCGVAVIVAVATTKLNDPSEIEDFYHCLPALNNFESDGYFKIKYSLAKALLAILLATIGMMLVIMLVKYVTKNGKHKQEKRPHSSKEIASWTALYRFSKAEIENAINYGNEKKCLGRGSAGMVYKGILPSGQVVAIKQIYRSNSSDSFTREVESLSRVRHPNLVCLFGCCIEDGEQYLVYEYCSAGNLAQHLLKKEAILPWERRVKILRDCAFALRYLHHYVDGCIVHRDIKLTNILLTENLEAKLSDFGLAKVLQMEESKVFTDVRGTIGYMDPEYMSNAKLTCASDIYSFGIVALQVLSGQKVIELDLDARDQLTRKAKDVSMGKRPLTDFEDPRLQGNLNSVDFESILQIAVLCAAKSSDGRPSIDVVFEELDKAWKNTLTDMKAKSKSATSRSRSIEVMPV